MMKLKNHLPTAYSYSSHSIVGYSIITPVDKDFKRLYHKRVTANVKNNLKIL